MTRISVNFYQFAPKSIQTDTSTKGTTTEDANQEKGESELQTTWSDESTPAATLSDTEAKGTSTNERPKTKFSSRKQTQTKDFRLLTATIQVNRPARTIYVPLRFAHYEKQALLDTNAIQSAMSGTGVPKSLTTLPMALIKETPAPDSKVQ